MDSKVSFTPVSYTHLVDNLKETGKAQVRGMEWTVRTEKDEETVEKGEVVTIVKVQGVKLIVKRRKEEIL